jgi:dipeptidase E
MISNPFFQPGALRIILASSLDSAHRALGPVWTQLEGKRAFVVTTARLGEGRPFAQEDMDEMEDLGLHVCACDIRDHDRENLAQQLNEADLCILIGGNTFVLMHAMRASGFDRILNDRAMKGGVLVIGESAGAVVLGPSIGHVSGMDDPSAAPEVLEAGLGWVAKPVLAHRGSPHWGLGEAVDVFLASGVNELDFLIIDEEEIVEIRNGAPLLS